MAEASLKTKTLSGMIWSFVQRFGTMAISFVSNIILARLLSPDDYGIIGMLMIFIAVANTFVDGGFGSALIQKKEPTREDYSTIFWWNMFLSLVLYGVLYMSAPAVARFYDLPLLSQVLRVQGFVLILNALSIIQQNQLRKQLKFKRLASVTVASAVLSAVIAIVLAYLGWGVWALVAQQLMLSGFTAILLWVLNKWYPLLSFSKESFKQLFGFGGFMLLSSLINTIFNNINSLIIGKLFSASTMGYFSQAKKIEDATAMSVTSVVEQVTYPILSEHQNDKNKMRSILKRFNTCTFFIVTPMMLLICLFAEPIVVFLFTEKWLPVAPYLKILALHGIPMGLQGVNYNAIAAIGKSKTIFATTIIKRIMTISLMLIGVYIADVEGLLWGMVVSSSLIILYNMILVSKYLDYRVITQIKELSGIAFVSACSFLIVLCFQNWATINNLILVIIFIATYTALSYTLKIEVLRNIASLLTDRIRK
ncbi:MAG: lipopolysaccharide biosynthesis protein [Rikenellaceae bacterium]|nr:lipopolysaccharide biosynthesis protein [Rikenellaceae bacterium]